ncbi:glycerol kinase [Nakamurella panacisegetis]|uniref:ATP:glycerol 3-phosphotransferase n=1 Tax=Nakamurella panacisegetis TaxID=1090615 RepID=A0A1H0NF47_9ACTN|nr:FGGY family carbohydrate kinase [Nakamurella panacisegetis]SDO91176.1 glycerol kinase [Nakamurella panacisegetis]
MSQDNLVLAVDQGSGSTKALLVSSSGAVVASASVPVASTYPRPGWVEQSPAEILDSVRGVVARIMQGHDPSAVVAVGFSTQRESLLLWDRRTGHPISPLISWQDQRSAGQCQVLAEAGHADLVRSRSGLPLDPMFSATKATWLLDAYDPDRSNSRAGRLCLGTVDSWLISRFGAQHLIEVGNASRTQLLDIHTGKWDEDLLTLFGVPAQVLGEVVASTGPFPTARGLDPLRADTPITAVLGDSHAALFAHAGWNPGTVKATYGTGSSVMGLCPPGATVSPGLCLTIAWDTGAGPNLAMEGNIRSSGATLNWLSRLFGQSPAALAALADTATSDGVHIVPAFNGLGAPYWDRDAVGLLSGLTLGTELPQIARAALESVAFQVEDVVAAIDRSGVPVSLLLADGGASGNPVLMQLQADTSGRLVARAADADLSSLGAAHLAGRQVGLWSTDDLQRLPRKRQTFVPSVSADERESRQRGWSTAVLRSRPPVLR